MTKEEIFILGLLTLVMGITGIKSFTEDKWPLGAFCIGIIVIGWVAMLWGTK